MYSIKELSQEYADHQVEREYPDLSPNLKRSSRMSLNIFDGTDLELAFETGALKVINGIEEIMRVGCDDLGFENLLKEVIKGLKGETHDRI